MRRYGAAVVLGALLVTTACGGSGSDRPSADEVSKSLRKAGEDSMLGPAAENMSKKAADCIAQELVDSKVSDTTLEKIVAGDKDYQPSKADETALAKAAPDMVRCISKS